MGCVPHLGNARETLVTSRVLRCAEGMGSGLSMGARREITKKYAREYASASKKVRGRLLDELVATTGWSRANARRQVAAAMIDRLVHHAEVLSLAGDSYRTRARRALLQQQATNNTTENNNQQGGQISAVVDRCSCNSAESTFNKSILAGHRSIRPLRPTQPRPRYGGFRLSVLRVHLPQG